ncbi:MAG: hypothetical protein KKF74_05015 [Nanoarchaeota archaeon]|nr:hypothetical protein [Nanoarchaeota archaeon]
MAKEKSALKVSKIKKKWYQILAPKEFNEMLIGETPSLDPRLLIGKIMTINLMGITRDIKKQNINITFRVTGLKENKAETEIIGYKVMPAFIKRIIRKGRNNLHDSFVCKTSDEKDVRLKSLVITVNKTKGAVVNSLMKALRANLTEYVRKITYKELVNELVSHKLQSNLKISLRKIYPLRSLEIKEMLLEAGKKAVGKKESKGNVKEESNKAEEKKPDKPQAKEKKEETKPKKDKPKEREANQDNSDEEEAKPKKEKVKKEANQDNSNKKENSKSTKE